MANIFDTLFKSGKKPNLLASGNPFKKKAPALQAAIGENMTPQQTATAYSVVAPNRPTTAANPSATATNSPTTIKPPTSTLPPSGQSFVQGLANGGSTVAPPPATGSPSATGEPKNENKEQNAYLEYLKSVFNPEQLRTAQKNMEALNQRTTDEIARTRKEEDKLRKNDIGQLQAGQSYQLGENERLSNRSLADLAIAKGANLDIYNQMIGAGKSVYEAEQAQQQYDDTRADKDAAKNAPFELSEGQSRYEYDPSTGKYNTVASKGKTYAPTTSAGSIGSTFSGTLSPLAQAVQNGTIPITSLGVADRGKVAAELAQSGIQSPLQQQLQTTKTIISDLLNSPQLSKVSGLPNLSAMVPGTKNNLVKNQFNQLMGQLSLANRQQLKGQGAISDFEFKVLQDATTALGRNLSDKDFKAELQKIADVFDGKYALTNALNGSNNSSNTPAGTASGSDPLGIR